MSQVLGLFFLFYVYILLIKLNVTELKRLIGFLIQTYNSLTS